MNDDGRAAEARVGLFVVAALLILVTGSLWIVGSSVLRGRGTPYRVLMRSSGGVERGDPVMMAGVEIGRVENVTLRPGENWPVILEVALDSNVPIKKDSVAQIATSGLLGSNFLQIGFGNPGGPVLPPGGDILGEESPGLVEALARVNRLSERALELMSQTSVLLDRLSGDVRPVLTGLDGFLRQSAPRLSSALTRLDTISQKVEEGLADLPPLVENISRVTDSVQAALGPGGSRLTAVLDAAGRGLTSADGVLTIVNANREDLRSTLHDLRDAAANLKAFSQVLKERPYSLVRIKPEADRRPGQGVGKESP